MPRKPKRSTSNRINNLAVVSDLHAGCGLGLLPDTGVDLDDGGHFSPSRLQLKVWGMWKEFWGEAVPAFTHGEPYAVVCNGDAIDGVHHQATHQVTHNLTYQGRIAAACLAPVVEQCDGRFFLVRGTEAHVGRSGQEEERLAKELGAIPNQDGQYARNDLWIEVGGGLVHLMHHIGTTGSQAYEATSPHKHLVEIYAECGRWNQRPPDIVVRSHRHRYIETAMPAARGKARIVVTPAWQTKTPFVWRLPGAAITQPHIGGIVIRWVEESQTLFVREKYWTIERSATVTEVPSRG